MSRFSRLSGCCVVLVVSIAVQLGADVRCLANVTREEVERAIREGVRFLKSQQRADGSWSDVENEAKTGHHELDHSGAAHGRRKGRIAADSQGARLPSRVRAQRPEEHLCDRASNHGVRRSLARKRPVADRQQCLVAGTGPDQAGRPGQWAGSWTYSDSKRTRPGDNSNTQYALLGLHAASEAGVPVKHEVWELARAYWERARSATAAGPIRPSRPNQTASMTCAGISSLIITGLRRFQGQEFLQGDTIQNCGRGGINPRLQAGINWLADHFQVEPELRQRAAVEVLLPLRPGACRPADGLAVLRQVRLVSPGRRGARPRTRQVRRVLEGRAQ